jgi:hypothetical protein
MENSIDNSSNMEATIYSQIRKEKDDFMYSQVSIVPGYSFNQYQTIKRIYLYLNSKYEDSSQYLGRDKLFFNIVVPPCEVATKMLNLDTKDIRLLPQNEKSYFSTYLLEKELKQWLKTSKFANTLNKIADEAPKVGSVVLEKVTGKERAKVVDIRRLMLDPTVETIGQSRFVTTIHYMTPTELRESGWDNVDVAIDRFGNVQTPNTYEDMDGSVNQLQSTPYIKIYKRYGEVPEHWLKGGKSEKMVRALFIVAGADKTEVNEQGQNIGEAGVTLFKSKWHKEWPFKDFHYTKIKGRWLGLGVVEALFDVQERFNEMKNQKRVSMEISSQHWFQTKDKQIVRNILTDLESGALMTSPNGIEPIANEERNLAAFKDEEASYYQQSERLSFAYEAVRGESAAGKTTATEVVNATNQATSVFQFKKENFANFLRDFFNDFVMPQLLQELTPEHIMRFTGSAQELQKLDEAAANLYANDEIKRKVLNNESVTLELQGDLIKKATKKYRSLGDNRFLKIKEAFYNDAEFEFDFNIINEQIDVQNLAKNTSQVITAVASNPLILQDPRIKLLFYQYAQMLGVSPAQMELADSQAMDAAAKQPQPKPGGNGAEVVEPAPAMPVAK